jgi:hypothetical protein
MPSIWPVPKNASAPVKSPITGMEIALLLVLPVLPVVLAEPGVPADEPAEDAELHAVASTAIAAAAPSAPSLCLRVVLLSQGITDPPSDG